MTAQNSPTPPTAGSGGATATGTTAPCGPCPTATIVFSKSTLQRYGYDDFDTPTNNTDDHVNIKKSDHTFVRVDITGGVGTDFDFVCDDPTICTPVAPSGSAGFDLRLNAGSHNKANTVLRARCKCNSSVIYASIAVHVYKEKLVEVVVAKIVDSTVAATALNYATADYAAHTATVNDKVKEAVVKYSITNYDASNGTTDVRYDLDGNGALSYDINAGGGAELQAIRSAMTGTGSKVRVAIVRFMKSYYYLASAAAAGDTTLTVTSSSVFKFPPGTVQLGSGSTAENVTVASTSGNTVTLSAPLANAQPAGAGLEFPAGGRSSDPILIHEGTRSLDVIKWTIPHEAGHRALSLEDVVDTNDIMHWSRSWTDYRLRYCPRNKKHGTGGTENQWETIPR